MTIARRRPNALSAIAPMPSAPVVRPPVPEMGTPVPLVDVPAPGVGAPTGRLRRCTFRRIDSVSALPGRSASSQFEVMCLYGSADEPLALGDVTAASRVCEACIATGIFRPDED